jgi:hypothetical protein
MPVHGYACLFRWVVKCLSVYILYTTEALGAAGPI